MNNTPASIQVTPPRLIATLVKGFNTVASQVHLILIPLVVDLILWLGPKLHVKALFAPVVDDITTNALKLSPSDLVETVTSAKTLWDQMLSQLNLFTAIRTFPVGVPSIIARLSPVDSPLSGNWIYETPSLQVGVAILGALLVTGFFLGSVYFYAMSRFSNAEPEIFDWKRLFSAYVQSLLLFLIIIIIAILVSVPILIIISVLTVLSPGLGQVVILVAGFMAVWIIMPLVFSPHGIFVIEQKAFQSMLLSLRLVRFFLPGAGLFILVSVLISEGLNMLWTLPEANTWLTLVGIGGHAFIVTALLTASFIYYRDGLKWMQFNIQKMAEARLKQEIGGTPVD